ncbi:MAG: glycine zipper domain-containing protein [Polyangiales bacterium]
MVGGASEAIRAYDDFSDGTIDGVEYAKRVTLGTASGAVSAGGRTAAALTLKEGAKQVAIRTGTESLRRVAGSNVATAVSFAVVEQGIDTVALIRGTIDGREYGARTTGTLGTTGGAYGGALVGASIGSAVPLVGTAVGAVIGGLVGALGGGAIGRKLGRFIFG